MSDLPMLYSRTADGAVNVWSVRAEGDEVVTTWGQQDGQMQTSRFKCLPKNTGKKNATTAEEQAIKEAKALHKKKLKDKYNESEDAAGQTVRLKPMLAKDHKDSKHTIVYPADIQPKLDGVRCLANVDESGQVCLWSRKGEPWLLDHIKDALKPYLSSGVVLDGELYIHGVSLQYLTSLARRPREESNQLIYCIFDVFSAAGDMGPWRARSVWLEGLAKRVNDDRLWFVPSAKVYTEEGIRQQHESMVSVGYEGTMIRNLEGKYKQGPRSPDLLKLKSFMDQEFPIIGWFAGKGKSEREPMFTCQTPNGLTFDVSMNCTAQEKWEMLQKADSYIGQLMKVKFFKWTDEGKPFLPRGLGIRYPEDM